MNRYAIVFNGVVENVAVANEAINESWILIPAGLPVQIGWLYIDGELVPPEI